MQGVGMRRWCEVSRKLWYLTIRSVQSFAKTTVGYVEKALGFSKLIEVIEPPDRAKLIICIPAIQPKHQLGSINEQLDNREAADDE